MTSRFKVTTWMAFADFFAAIAVISICLYAAYQRPADSKGNDGGLSKKSSNGAGEGNKSPEKPKPTKTLEEYKSKRIANRLKSGALGELQGAIAPTAVEANGSVMQVLLFAEGSIDFQSPIPDHLDEGKEVVLKKVFEALFDQGLLQSWAENWRLRLVSVRVHAVGSIGDESQHLAKYSDVIVRYLQAEAAGLGIPTRLDGSTADYSPRRVIGHGSLRLALYFDLTQDGHREAEADYDANKPI